eukprot:5850873-Amphidinium_carterae.1
MLTKSGKKNLCRLSNPPRSLGVEAYGRSARIGLLERTVEVRHRRAHGGYSRWKPGRRILRQKMLEIGTPQKRRLSRDLCVSTSSISIERL